MQFWMFQVNSAHIRYNAISVLKALDVFRLANIFFSFCRWTQLCSPFQHVYLYFPLEVVAPKNLSEKYALNSKYIIIRQIWAHKNAKQLNRTSKKINQSSFTKMSFFSWWPGCYSLFLFCSFVFLLWWTKLCNIFQKDKMASLNKFDFSKLLGQGQFTNIN